MNGHKIFLDCKRIIFPGFKVWKMVFLLGSVLLGTYSCRYSERAQSSYSDSAIPVQIPNPILPGYYAEPTLVPFEDKFYLYATIDPWDDVELAVWETSDFRHWQLRRINWPTRDQCKSVTGSRNLLGSPEVVQWPDGKFYMYVISGREIWAGQSEHPLGPWYDLCQGKPLLPNPANVPLNNVHASCFQDSDGKAYLYWTTQINWNNSRCQVAPLEHGILAPEGREQDVTPPDFFEAAEVLVQDGRYYMLYSDGRGNNPETNIRYAMANSPFGPWKVPDNSGNAPIV